MKPSRTGKWSAGRGILWLCLLLLALTLGFMLADDGESDRSYRHDISPGSHTAMAAGSVAVRDGEALTLVMEATDVDPWIDFPLAKGGEDVREKLKVEFGETSNLSAMILSYPNHPRRGQERYARVVDLERGFVYFGLSPTKDDRLRLTFVAANRRAPVALKLEGLTIMSRSAIDSKRFFVLFALGTAAFLSLAGTILATLYRHPPPGSDLQAGVLLPTAVVGYLLLVYLAMVVARELAALPAAPAALATGVALLVAALIWQARRDRCARFVETFGKWSGSIAGYLVVVTIATFVVMDGVIMPLQEVFWSHIAHYKTFGGHTAHDLGFQYLNGLAIAQDRPFSDFYEAPHMVRGMFYDVEDRQILAGALYAAYRSMLMAVSPYVGDTYAAYALFGIALTALAVFPIIAFCRRYTRLHSTPAILFVLSANAFVLVNYYYTWFKLLGGGFVIAGVLLLAVNTSAMRHWVAAGLLFGIAASFHSGAALTLPFVVLYFLVRLARERGGLPLFAAGRFTALVLAFVVVIAPWTFIKTIHFQDTGALLRQHFLHGEHFDGSLWNTARNFFGSVPLDEQLGHRMSQVVGALRIERLQRIADEAMNDSIPEFLHAWSRYEYKFIAILLYPLLFLLAISALLRPLVGPASPSRAPPGDIRHERNMLFAVAGLSIVAVMFAMFTGGNVDSMSLVPSAAVVIVYLLTANALCGSSRIGSYLLFPYLAFSTIRLLVSLGEA